VIPAPAYRGACAACAEALVASKTISGSWSRASSQSTPPALAATPSVAARASPSEAGSTPTTYRRSTADSSRSSFIIRSVPMLPDPTIAAVTIPESYPSLI
jgi:hypothetical protein